MNATSHERILADLPGHQSPLEEFFNSLTHGLGAIASIVGLVVMIVMAADTGDPYRIVAASIYGASMVLLFTGSALYHGITNMRLKHIFWVLDHAFIYLLIAGTYTPFTLVTIRGGWGWSIFGIAWGLAILGIVFKLVAIGKYPKVSIALYLIMGWIIVIAAYPLIMAMSWSGLALLGLGGLLYTLGTIFYGWYSLRFGHVVWHLFVLGGAAAHFFAVLYYVIPLEG
ncbi:MAG: hemolysin III family protein [Deltaproteobacteria bacterium]|nr:MAG: hemolysin III family protein [Deltaproteobacteria bacterium]